jgi:hypothetical protein
MLILIGHDKNGAFAAYKPMSEVVKLIKEDPAFTVGLVECMEDMEFNPDDISPAHWMQLRKDILNSMRASA